MQPKQFSMLAPEMTPFSSASPISSRPPPAGAVRLEDALGAGGSGGGGELPAHDSPSAAAAGEEVERAAPGNRWPRQEAMALLKIRSDMDAAFRDATLKGPLWEEVSRKLAELGYQRSSKKCKEKFENMSKYYKWTKDSRAARAGAGDGKNYRFFSQLEALNNAAPSSRPLAAVTMPMPLATAGTPIPVPVNVSFSSGSSESDRDDSDEDTQDICPGVGGDEESGKRKRRGGAAGGASRKRMTKLFEGLMMEVMQRQEAMQQRFLEAMEKREEERMIREEAWHRQEMSRLAREQEVLAEERAMAASRDAAVVAFIHKATGQTVQLPPMPPPPQPQPIKPLQQQPPPATAQQHGLELALLPVQQEGVGPAAASRWPKAEVHALIELRTSLDARYQEAGPKGPLWEEIAVGMRRLGYSRSSKRCKEKWENINKYFKKVKDRSKRRPEDSKTCPYFHQLDALYRTKQLTAAVSPIAPLPPPESCKNGGDGVCGGQASTSAPAAKPEESTTSEVLAGVQQQAAPAATMDDGRDSDDITEDEEGDFEDDDNEEAMQYEIRFQRPSATASTASCAADNDGRRLILD